MPKTVIKLWKYINSFLSMIVIYGTITTRYVEAMFIRRIDHCVNSLFNVIKYSLINSEKIVFNDNKK